MGKTYWIMKNPGSSSEWVKLTGKQFYDFVTSPAAKGRYFADFDTCKIEVSHEQYVKWKREENHKNYLHSYEDKVSVLSLESLIKYEGITGSSLINTFVNVEDEAMHNLELRQLSQAFMSLTVEEKRLIYELFLRDKPKTMRETTESTGIPFQTVHFRKNKILKKLKKLLDKP